MRRFLPLGSCLLVALHATTALAQLPPTYITSWGSAGTGPGQFSFPFRIATDAAGLVYAFDAGRVQIFTGDGVFLSQWVTQTPSSTAYGIAVDGLGRVHLVLEPYVHSIYHEIYSATGTPLDSRFLAGPGCECTLHIDGIAATSNGDSYITRWGSTNIIGFPSTPVAHILHSIYQGPDVLWGSPGTGPGQLTNPTGVAVDGAGFAYVVDNGLVQKYTSDGTFVTRWNSVGSTGGSYSFWSIAVGPNGHVYAAGLSPPQIQEFASDGTFLSSWGSSGGGPGQFSFIYGIAVDGAGNIFVADGGNNRIEKFGPAPTPTVRSSWGRLKTIYR